MGSERETSVKMTLLPVKLLLLIGLINAAPQENGDIEGSAEAPLVENEGEDAPPVVNGDAGDPGVVDPIADAVDPPMIELPMPQFDEHITIQELRNPSVRISSMEVNLEEY